MFKPGDIVYHDFLLFSDGFIETKEEKCRPCIVLNSVDYNGFEFVVTVPCTTKMQTFNKGSLSNSVGRHKKDKCN